MRADLEPQAHSPSKESTARFPVAPAWSLASPEPGVRKIRSSYCFCNVKLIAEFPVQPGEVQSRLSVIVNEPLMNGE